jgi:uncharacterized membrane protein
MAMDNLILYIATYDDAAAAAEDYKRLQAAREVDLEVVSSVVMHRDADGKVTVDEHGTGQVASGAMIGGAAGLVVGLFAPPLLAATAVGAGIGAVAGKIAERREEKKIGVDMEEALPPNSSAILAIIDDKYLDRIDAALDKSLKKVQKAIDKDDYEALQKAIDEGGDRIAKAVAS